MNRLYTLKIAGKNKYNNSNSNNNMLIKLQLIGWLRYAAMAYMVHI